MADKPTEKQRRLTQAGEHLLQAKRILAGVNMPYSLTGKLEELHMDFFDEAWRTPEVTV